ncbi:alpha/beta hydrolase [Cupriavidus plantarum]|uniref:alpha/beta hydrolase n=1 Tax=Cupriavidus plantarum TaxID=942865 RepID=UPI000E278162|nr:alpha/beta hydrolase [Cupriavidus plantarum]NYH97368.1 lysophospholipase [Cupriavidus plantarum]REE92697.1 lysophospholipase [Cupriavidus plantarum]
MDEPVTIADDNIRARNIGRAGAPPDQAPASMPILPAEGRHRMRDGTELLLRTWLPDPLRYPEPLGTLLLVHGMGEHCGRYQHVAEALCALGLRVRAYDHRGHGLSGGPRMVVPHANAYVDDLAEIYDGAVRQWNELPIVLGHSMGGLVAARFATARVRPIRALILSSPALALFLSPRMLTFQRVLMALAPRLRVPTGLDATGLSHDAEAVRAYRTDPLVQSTVSAGVLETFVRGMSQAQADAARLEAPTLMLVAGADRIVDPAGSRTFHGNAPDDLCSMEWFPEGYHELFNETEPLRGEAFVAMTDWLRRHLR